MKNQDLELFPGSVTRDELADDARLGASQRKTEQSTVEGGAADQVLPGQHLARIAVDRISPAPEGQARRDFDAVRLQALAESLKRSGVREPIIVTPHGAEPGRFQIVAGERRWRAAQLAGLAEIPCIVDAGLSERKDKLLAQAEENLQRENLNAVEEAAVLAQLMKARQIDASEAGELIGKSSRQARRLHQLHEAPDLIKSAVIHGRLDARAALEMLRIYNRLAREDESPAKSRALSRVAGLIERFVSQGWSIRRLEEHAARIASHGRAERSDAADAPALRSAKPAPVPPLEDRRPRPAPAPRRRRLVVEADGVVRIDRQRIERHEVSAEERESLVTLLEGLLGSVRGA